MSKTMLCNGQYVTNDPCYPVCSLPDGSGCDYDHDEDYGHDFDYGNGYWLPLGL